MIIRKNENWFRMLFIWQGSVLPMLLPRLLILFCLSVLIVYFKGTLYDYKVPLNPAPFTIFGLALALFLGFRNTASYDRFWEGRKLWGALLIDTRSLIRQTTSLTTYEKDSPEVRDFAQILIAFSYALKHQLRHSDPSSDLAELLPKDVASQIANARFKPVALLQLLGFWIKKAYEEQAIDTISRAAIDQNLNKLSDIVGGCERIASTPLPYTYKVLLHRTVYLYCFMLPFGLVDSLGWLTPFITCFIAYTFVAFEAIADELEDPFGTSPNDLPLNEICNTIKISLLETIGEPALKITPVKGYIVD